MNKQMSLEIADDWLKFMELASSDIVIFVGKVPQSLLPYPKETIEEALGIVSQHLASVGNEEGLDGIKNSMAFLGMYIDDKEALENAAKHFNDPDHLKAFLPKLGESQKKRLEYLKSKYKSS